MIEHCEQVYRAVQYLLLQILKEHIWNKSIQIVIRCSSRSGGRLQKGGVDQICYISKFQYENLENTVWSRSPVRQIMVQSFEGNTFLVKKSKSNS